MFLFNSTPTQCRNTSRPNVGILLTACMALLAVGCMSPSVWIEETRTLTVPVANLSGVMVETHNGDVDVKGGAADAELTAIMKCRFGGKDMPSAEACRDALEIVSETGPDGVHQFRTRWKELKARDWSAQVDFQITSPTRFSARVASHNGDVTVTDLSGACNVTSHNGDIHATVQAASLQLETHNGDIHAAAPLKDVKIDSHNGDIHVQATAAAPIRGSISSFNGTIIAHLSEGASTQLQCRTFNGSIKSTLPWQTFDSSRGRATGTLNNGTETLKVDSHNGNVSLLRIGA